MKEQQMLQTNCTLLITFNVITFSQVTVPFKIEKKLKLASFMTQTSKTCLVKIVWYCRLAIDRSRPVVQNGYMFLGLL